MRRVIFNTIGAAFFLATLAPKLALAAELNLDQLNGEARKADIVILGEIHDNPGHHQIQAKVVAMLDPAALVFEMIPEAKEETLNTMRSQGASRVQIAEALEWDESGWPDFAFYAPILEAAPSARVFGAGQPIGHAREAARDGAAAAFGERAHSFGIDRPLALEERDARESLMARSHCNYLPEQALPGMVEVQRFRDAGLADAALRARERTQASDRVVIIAGSGHADRRWAVPALIGNADPDLRVLAIGLQENGSAPKGAFDLEIRSDPPDREDPCAAFEKSDK